MPLSPGFVIYALFLSHAVIAAAPGASVRRTLSRSQVNQSVTRV